MRLMGILIHHGPVAQWMRAFASGAKGRGFEPHRGHQISKPA